jgi:hypothetical protein
LSHLHRIPVALSEAIAELQSIGVLERLVANPSWRPDKETRARLAILLAEVSRHTLPAEDLIGVSSEVRVEQYVGSMWKLAEFARANSPKH